MCTGASDVAPAVVAVGADGVQAWLLAIVRGRWSRDTFEW